MHPQSGQLIATLSVLSLLTLGIARPSLAADESKIIRLEMDVRQLEQQVRDLSREVAELRRNSGNTMMTPAPSPPERAATAPPPESQRWLRLRNWRSLRSGMSELQVAETLGPPTSTRASADNSTTWFYALEIGTDSFLGGSVLMREGKVVEIKTPVLK